MQRGPCFRTYFGGIYPASPSNDSYPCTKRHIFAAGCVHADASLLAVAGTASARHVTQTNARQQQPLTLLVRGRGSKLSHKMHEASHVEHESVTLRNSCSKGEKSVSHQDQFTYSRRLLHMISLARGVSTRCPQRNIGSATSVVIRTPHIRFVFSTPPCVPKWFAHFHQAHVPEIQGPNTLSATASFLHSLR